MTPDRKGGDEDAWFDDSFGARSRTAPNRARTQIGILAGAIGVVLIAGVALGAFSGGEDAPPLSDADRSALALAEGASADGMLADRPLIEAFDRLITERRAQARRAEPASPTVAAADTPAPAVTDEAGDAPVGDPVPPTEAAPPIAPPPETVAATEAPRAPDRPRPAPPAPRPRADTHPAPAPVAAAPAAAPPRPAPEPAPEPAPAPAPADAQGAHEAALAEAKAALGGARWADAETAYSTALEAKPRDANALAGRGHARFELKQIAAAKKDLEAALAVSPSHPRALMILGSIAQDQGDKASACRYYGRFLDYHPKGRYADQVRAIIAKLGGC